MPKFSEESKSKLATCVEPLQRLFNEVIKHFDCKVTEGHRSKDRQATLYSKGLSKVMHGKHNESPSEAIDVAPYPIDYTDSARFYFFAGVVKGIASQMGIEIRWGGDWDGDTEVKDQSFNDLSHYEYIGEVKTKKTKGGKEDVKATA